MWRRVVLSNRRIVAVHLSRALHSVIKDVIVGWVIQLNNPPIPKRGTASKQRGFDWISINPPNE